ncbi:hypothetical protein ACFVVA_36940 [Kitasatospora sp. NPDC058048]|uniref:hypothetical protein n=1 Tax=Kitasatospora sp. NPDC058048 TaxID=3346313 RepID=UPI0036DCBF8C
MFTITTPAADRLDVIEALRVVCALYTVRAHFQPVSRAWEERPPTAHEAEAYLHGYDRPQLRAEIDGVHDAADQAENALQWCLNGARSTDTFRRRLAAVARQPLAPWTALPLLASVPAAMERARAAAETREAARRSRHLGVIGQRLTGLTLRVVRTVRQEPRRYAYHVQPRTWILLRDPATLDTLTWTSTSAQLPAVGRAVTLSGKVTAHSRYGFTLQTDLTNCRWKYTTGS